MNQEKLSQQIKNIRKKNNLTQAEFADKLGVTFQAVSKWENGKSIPDIDILGSISKNFNIAMDDLIGTQSKKHKKLYLITMIIILVIIIILLLVFLIFHKESFEFKTISTTCSEFTLTGSAAYSKDKTSIYISNINYCGDTDENIYKKIECSLYEKNNNNISLVNKCTSKNNITLEQYLKDLKINIDNYNSLCKIITSSDMYLEIKAIDSNNKITEYNIPLTFSDNC